MKIKTSLLTFCLVLCIAAVYKLLGPGVSANTTTAVCGRINAFSPATATTTGSIEINHTIYVIAPGTTLGGQPIIAPGPTLCFNLTLNNNNQVIAPSGIGDNTLTKCGAINNFRPARNNSIGSISIGSSSYTIGINQVINGQNQIGIGSDMCLIASLDISGFLKQPSTIVVNNHSPISICGEVSDYTPPTDIDPGFLGIGNMNFTIAPGTNLGFVSVGSFQCLQGRIDVDGRLAAPSTFDLEASGPAKICGTVNAFSRPIGNQTGSITISGVTLPIAQRTNLIGQDEIKTGLNICIAPSFENGLITRSSVISSDPSCFQFTTPLLTHGTADGKDDTFLLHQPLTFSVVTQNSGAWIFPLNKWTFGLAPEFGGAPTSGITAISPNTTVQALSCTDSFWDVFFYLATKGQTEGDMITLSLQHPNGAGSKMLAMLTVLNGGLMLNQLHPDITFFINFNGPHGAGAFIPLLRSAGSAGVRTPHLTLIISMDEFSPLNGCYQLAVDIKRLGGDGMTSFVPTGVIVKRMGDEVEGVGLSTHFQGLYPTGLLCTQVCNGCFPQPTPSPTPTPPPPTPTPTPTPEPTPTPTPPPMPIKCDTICFRSHLHFLNRIDNLPNGSILIGGVNVNAPINIQRNKEKVRQALFGGLSPLQQINQQFVATQISMILYGGTGAPAAFNTLWSSLRCSGITFPPVTLSNGVTIDPDSLVNTLFVETQNAIKQSRTADMIPLVQILALLNSRC